MSKFVQNASYYVDDKDLADLFKAQNVSPRFLLKFGRRRGLFLSEKAKKSELVRALSMAPLAWEDVLSIAEEISTEDKGSKQMTTQLTGGIDFNKVAPAIESVKTWLEGNREVVTITKASDNHYFLNVKFIELQPQRTRPLQRLEREVTIEVERVGETLDIRYGEHPHGKEVVRKLIDNLPTTTVEKRVERQVSLWSVRDPVKRIKFFTGLINGLKGFILSGVTDLHVDCRLPEEEDPSHEEEEEKKKKEEKLVGLVKHAVLSGDSLLNSELYAELKKAGYYIGSIVWTANETGGDQRQIEFYAGFKDEILATDFIFDVRRVAKRDEDGNYGKPERGQPIDRAKLLKLIETAAYSAMDVIQEEKVPKPAI